MPNFADILQSNPHGWGPSAPAMPEEGVPQGDPEAEAKRQRFIQLFGVDPAQSSGQFAGETLKNFGAQAAPLLAAEAMGPAAGAIGSAVRAAPKMSAALLGTLGASTLPADAGEVGLKKSQQREIEMERQRQELQMQADEAHRKGDLDSQRQRANDAAAAKIKEQQMQAEFEAAQKAKAAGTPFREAHPTLASALQIAGMTGAFALPLALKGKANLGSFMPGSYAGRINSAADAAESAIAAKDVGTATLKAKELQNLVASKPTLAGELGKAGLAGLAGGALAAEGNMIPDQLDAFNLPEGQAKDKAWSRITDPRSYRDRALIGAATGLSGYEAGRLVPSRIPNVERAASLSSILDKGHADDVATVGANIGAKATEAPVPHWTLQDRAPNGRFGSIAKNKKSD